MQVSVFSAKNQKESWLSYNVSCDAGNLGGVSGHARAEMDVVYPASGTIYSPILMRVQDIKERYTQRNIDNRNVLCFVILIPTYFAMPLELGDVYNLLHPHAFFEF